MNILPKKTWHVLRKQNVERVRNDEKLATERQREQEKRAELAESEFYLETLKSRTAASRSGVGSVSSRLGDTIGPQQATNVDYEREKREEQEKLEKRIGLLNYLVDNDSQRSIANTWYLKRAHPANSEGQSSSTVGATAEFDVKKKARLDPLNEMRKYERVVEKQRAARSDDKPTTAQQPTTRSGPVYRSVSSDTNRVGLDELRRARVARELAERQREDALRKRATAGGAATKPARPPIVDERQLPFNSQFNPDLARQNRPANPSY